MTSSDRLASESTKRLKTAASSFSQELLVEDSSDHLLINYEATWQRPNLPVLDPAAHDIVFQQIEIDEFSSDLPRELPNPFELKTGPAVRMYGITTQGNSVALNVHGFMPYFYVPAPYGFEGHHLQSLKENLEALVKSERKYAESTCILSVELVMKKSIFGYRGKENVTFIKITTGMPQHIAPARRHLERGFEVAGLGQVAVSTTYETNLGYVMRFMIDTGVVGCNWITVKKGKYYVRGGKGKFASSQDAVSNCQLELDCYYSDFVSHEPEGDFSTVAPLRILSFDIECEGRKGHFPDAKIDSVIQIANMVTLQGESKPFIRNVFTYKACANIAGTHVLSFEHEADMLMKWREFIERVDPDMIIGYNTTNFDFPYLIDRSIALKLDKFPFLGRIRESKTTSKDSRFSSKAFGTRDSKQISLDGRLQMDLYVVMTRDYKLRSYTLNSVCAHFLGEQKEDVHYSIITELQNGNDETRRRLAVYCLKDAYLPQRLMDKLMCVYNYMEMARVTGVPFNYLLTRGQQIKVVSQLYRKAREEGLLIPAYHVEGTDEQYEGATVIDPEKGFYQMPIATLDFASLYPSIMMAHNLCYSTYLESKSIADSLGLVEDVDYVKTPNNDYFVKEGLKKGLLPMILEDLLSARKKAKRDLKNETDPFKKGILDGRQLALKISANSVYGFTGATVGKLPLLAISSSVTAYGRSMIETTKEVRQQLVF